MTNWDDVTGSYHNHDANGNEAVVCLRFPGDLRRSALARARKRGIPVITARGSYGRYGYDTYTMVVDCPAARELYQELVGGAAAAKKNVKTEAETTAAWARRLARLAVIPTEDAEAIAAEKIEYKAVKIAEMEARQAEQYSVKRAQLIRQMERANPLRRIEDAEHAQNIIAASRRHNETDYEARLDEARDLAAIGEIDKGEIKDYAKANRR